MTTSELRRFFRKGGDAGPVPQRDGFARRDPTAADAWVRKPNTAAPFGGRSALAHMLGGNVADLYVVRRYLDGVRGGGWS